MQTRLQPTYFKFFINASGLREVLSDYIKEAPAWNLVLERLNHYAICWQWEMFSTDIKNHPMSTVSTAYSKHSHLSSKLHAVIKMEPR